MNSFDQYKSVDYSPFLIHLTRDTGKGHGKITGESLIRPSHDLFQFTESTAFDKLQAILETKSIKAAPQPDLPNKPEAACFSETVWGSIRTLTGNFSSYGIGFNKKVIFDRGGGPVLYTRGDIVQDLSLSIPPQLEPFVKPFDPLGQWLEESNFLYEREWRVPRTLQFEFEDIQFILVDSYKDASEIIRRFGSDNIPDDRVIVMESHRRVMDTWGVFA
ncbi:MAG: hypothetical protein F4W93_08270 [Dehalococcoidia bacterium]|nr:hypothetical protein [Dehalococcoidia bacterium]